MTEEPRVSVVVIFRDAERFLEEAVASVFAQTCSDWELLVVDDGSVDGSPVLARRMAERQPERVLYLQHPGGVNRGMSASRNLGIRHARGDYVAFLDADDVWLPGKLAEQVALLEHHPEAAMVYGPTQWWYSWTGRAEDRDRDFVHPLGVPANSLVQPPDLLLQLLQNEGASPCTCSIMVRREVVQRAGRFEDRFKGLYEDQVFCAKVCLGSAVFVSNTFSSRYRQHEDSACSDAELTRRARSARLRFLHWLEEYLSEQRVEDAEIWKALRRERWRSQHPWLERGLLRAQRLTGRTKGAPASR